MIAIFIIILITDIIPKLICKECILIINKTKVYRE
jgi:hypothetical protein